MSDRKPEHRRGYYLVVLVIGVVLSVAGNALHAWSAWHAAHPAGIGDGELGPAWSVLGTAIFPLILLMMTEMTMLAVTRFGGLVRWGLTVLAGCVAVISFAVSYEALVYTSRTVLGVGDDLSTVAPLVIDLPIIGATIALWAVADRIRRDAAVAADRPMTTQTIVVSDHEDQLVTTATDQAATTPVVLVTDHVDHPVTSPADHLVTTATDHSDRSRVTTAELVESVVSDRSTVVTDHRDHDGDRVLTDRVTTLDGPVSDRVDQVVTDPAVAIADHTVTTAGEEATEPVTDHGDRSTDQPVTVPLDIRSVAERVRETKDLDVATDVLTEALELLADGVSRRKVAEAVNVGSHNTVKRWADAAADLDPAYAAAIGRPRARGWSPWDSSRRPPGKTPPVCSGGVFCCPRFGR